MSILIYADIPVNNLYFGVPRNLNETRYVYAREKIKDSILKEGLNNPLCCGNVKQDGTYKVNRGNQCLAALQELNIDTVSCIVCCKNNSLNNPKGVEIAVGEIDDLFKSGVERISEVSHPECFEIIPSDHQDFDPTLIMNL
jgi:hypothetical protein